MEHSTFRDPAVRERLQQFVVVKFQAEHVNDATTKPVLDELGVVGLPTYVLLRPEDFKAAGAPGASPSR
jgi:thiol:disulfide interchange protein